MSKRMIYRPRELRAGRTIFIVTKCVVNHRRIYAVAEYLICGWSEPQPEPGVAHPYRMHPFIAAHASFQTDLWRTRRAAQREAARRQADYDAQFPRRIA